MRLHTTIIMSYKEGFSGAYIFCKEEEKEEILKEFKKIFVKRWFEKIKRLTQDYDENEYDIKCNEFPIRLYPDDEKERIFVKISPLDIIINYGNMIRFEDGNDVLEYSLKELTHTNPDVAYEAYIAYGWTNPHSCEIENYEVFSYKKHDDNPKYRFVTDVLFKVCQETSFWEHLKDSIQQFASEENQEIKEVFDEVCFCFESFGVGEETGEKLQKMKTELNILEEV